MRNLLLILLCLASISWEIAFNEKVECDWARNEHLCGNKCLNSNGICKCGLGWNGRILAKFDLNYCCIKNETSCTNVGKQLVICDGMVKELTDTCFGQCPRLFKNGLPRFFCDDKTECYNVNGACKGFPICKDKSDLAHCDMPNVQGYGGSQRCPIYHIPCGPLNGAKFQDYGCYTESAIREDQAFLCSNRKDLASILFNKTLNTQIKKKTSQLNLNTQLFGFNETSFQCTKELSIPYKGYMNEVMKYPGKICYLKNGQQLTLLDFTLLVFLQYSFKEFSALQTLDQENDYTKILHKRLCNLNEKGHNVVLCGNQKDICIMGDQVCDGVANCPHAEDEDFQICHNKSTFSPMATIKCLKKDIYNVDITILATKCDGITECKDGVDEIFCSISGEYFLFTTLFAISIIILVGFTLWHITVNGELIDEHMSITKENFNKLHGTDELKVRMFQCQSSKKLDEINRSYFKFEMEKHEWNVNETFCCIKNTMDSATAAAIIKQKPKSKNKSIWSKSIKASKRIIHYDWFKGQLEKLSMIRMGLSVLSHVLDLIKDLMLMIQFAITQGGLDMIMMQPEPYMLSIFYVMFGSITLPIVLSSIQFITNGHLFKASSWLGKFGMIICLPIYPILIIMREKMLIHASKTYKISVNQIEEAKLGMAKFIHADIGLEAFYQLLIQTILLFLARSETRTIFGMEKLFDENKSLYGISAETLLAYSIGWSLFSCVRSHLKGISKKRVHSHFKANILMLIFAMSSILQQMWSVILYFTPCLGLFNILRHLQGEMYPFNAYNVLKQTNDSFSFDKELFQFANATPIPWSKLTRWNYSEPTEPSPPSFTLYTKFSIGQYFWFFICIWCLHILLTILSKKWMNPKVFQKLNTIDILIHAIGNLSIPFPMEDWDEKGGTVIAHRQRMKIVFKEVRCTILLNFFANFILLLPLTILASNIFERHNILVNSIGTYPEENNAYFQIQLMIGLGFGLLLLLTMVQLVSYYLYNGKYHPFNKIVKKDKTFWFHERFELTPLTAEADSEMNEFDETSF